MKHISNKYLNLANDYTVSNEYEGTGLGLAICDRIIERHGGNISAKSKLGEGAKFIVTLPYCERGRVP